MNMSSEDMHVEYSIAMATSQLANKIMKNGLPDICKLAFMVFYDTKFAHYISSIWGVNRYISIKHVQNDSPTFYNMHTDTQTHRAKEKEKKWTVL